MIIKFKKLHYNAVIPKKSTEGAAGYDLYSCPKDNGAIIIPTGEAVLVPTGIAAEIPAGHFLMVCSRSGMALNQSVFVLNSPGIIDSDFRGEIGVILCNAGKHAFYVNPGDRVAQMIIASEPTASIKVVKELTETARGVGGFGSTGK